MKYFSVCIMLAIMLSPVCGMAKEFSVFCSGNGVSRDMAIQNALRRAIEEHLGIFISAESLVQNKELISSNIMTYSQGFVESYEVIQETNNTGGYQVQLAAEIATDKLEKSISELPQLKIDGPIDFINLRLEKERISEADKIAKHLVDTIIADGFIVQLGKLNYNSNTGDSETVDFNMEAIIRTNAKVWKQALEVLKKLNLTKTQFELWWKEEKNTKHSNSEYTHVEKPPFGDFKKVPVNSGILSIFKSMRPALIIQIGDEKGKPIHFQSYSITGFTKYGSLKGIDALVLRLGQIELVHLSGRVNINEVKHFAETKALLLPESEAQKLIAQYSRTGQNSRAKQRK